MSADAERIRALAQKIRHEVEAEGQRLMNEAQNVLSPAARASMLRRLLIEHLEAIVRESVKPMEKIDEIKILQVDGLLGGGGGGGGNGGASAEPQRPDRQQCVALSCARRRLIDKLLKEIGLPAGSLPQVTGGDLERLIDPAKGQTPGRRSRRPSTTSRSRPSGEMVKVYTSSVLDAPADKVWSEIRDFNGLPRWHPAIKDSYIEQRLPPTRWAACAISRSMRADASASGCWRCPTSTTA